MPSQHLHVLVVHLRRQPMFSLGQVVITTNAHSALDPADVSAALARHAAGDWGEVGRVDREENDCSLRHGHRLLSVYRSGATAFWIITEADRSVTTVLLPDDY